jgi:signal transduction histidine kinase
VLLAHRQALRINAAARAFVLLAIGGPLLWDRDGGGLLGLGVLGTLWLTLLAVEQRVRQRPLLLTFVESAAVTTICLLALTSSPAILGALAAPPFVAGLRCGAKGVLTALGTVVPTAAVLLGVLDVTLSTDELLAAFTWLTMGLGLGLIASFLRSALSQPDPLLPYRHASELLHELNQLSEGLDSGLEPRSLGGAILSAVRDELPTADLVLYVGDDELTPLLSRTLDDSGSTHTALLARLAQRSGRLETDGQTFAFPLRPESGQPGIVAGVFSDRLDPGALDLPRTVRRLTRQLEVSTVHLETALLFTAFRDAATADERRRLSREMHDGVAQEIASLGYLVDALAATPASDEQAARFLMLRERVSEVVAEVRRSVVTLRTTVGESESLGAAIGSLARNLSQLSGVAIEVTLDEKSQRLRGEIEAELFRITQEALNNAVKHAQCTLIRVHCHVDAPAATISVTDNGRGLGDIGLPFDARADSYGLGIMRERAALIGARLDIEEPPGGGLRVAVAVSSGHPATPTGPASESPREIQVSR